MSQQQLRLVDLLAEQELGLRLLTNADPQTVIRGAHAIEVPNPARWLKPEWLMLTTGTRFSGTQPPRQPQRDLIGELEDAGIAALGFGVGVSVQQVPDALLDEADRRGFPLVSVPLETPFLQVIDSVNKATQTGDARTLQRRVTIQDYLLESLADENADASLVRRLSELLRSTVVLYDHSGTIMASSGVGPTQIIRSEISGKAAEPTRFAVGRWHIHAEPVVTGNTVHWLAIASRRRAVSEELAEPATEAARRIVSMIVRSREAAQAEDRLRRAELLRSLVSGRNADIQAVWDRLEMHRFRRDDALRLIVLADTEWHSAEAQRLSEPERVQRVAYAERAAARHGLRLILAGHGEEIIGVVDAAWPEVEQWLEMLSATMHCGASEPFRDLSFAPVRLREAELALTSALRGQRRFLRFDEVGMLDWLVAGRELVQVEQKASRTLGPLENNEGLFAALAEYFACELDVQRTARRMALHPNSVRYRLKRAESMLRRNLRDPADIADIYLALRISHRTPT